MIKNDIYLWRIVFTYLICIFHFLCLVPIHFGWYIAVEFFFMVSGYLLYKDYTENKYTSAWSYTKHRLVSLYPYYICSFFIMFIAQSIRENFSIGRMISTLLHSIWEILLLQGAGLDRGWDYVNAILWYLSIVIIAGYIIFYLLRYEWYRELIVPLSVILIYAYFYRTGGGTTDRVMKVSGFFMNEALLRGLAGMNLGIICYRFREHIENKYKRYTCFKMIEILGGIVVIVASALRGYTQYDFLYIVILFFVVSFAFLPSTDAYKNGRGNRIILYFSRLSYVLYLNHVLFTGYIIPYFFGNELTGRRIISVMIVYLFLITVYSVLFKWIVDGIMKRIKCLYTIKVKGEK